MKNMKRMFVAAVALMAVLTVVALNSMDTLAVLAEDGFAVPADSGLSRLLSSGDGPAVSLVDVGYEDVVYSSLSGYYVGENRASIDRSFPIYINSGTGLRFLDEETWLVSSEVDLMRTYEGLYLADGYTYNSNLDQADAEEFILLALRNKLFMNAQAATFENRAVTRDIPSNSVLAMTESSIRWYYLDSNALVYAEEGSVFDAKLTIGSHTYDYANLLRALDLLEDAIHREENNLPTDEQTQEIEEILNGGDGNRRDPTHGDVRPGEAAEGVAPSDPDASGADGSGGDQNPGDGTEDENSGELNPDDPDASQPGQGGDKFPGGEPSTRPGGTGGSGSGGQGGSASDPGSSEGESGSAGNNPSDPEDGGAGSAGGDDGSGSGSGSAGTGGSGGSGGAGADGGGGAGGSGDQAGGAGDNQGEGDNQGDGSADGDPGSGDTGGDQVGDEDGDQPSDPGGGPPDDSSEDSGERNPNPNPGGNPNPNPDARPKPKVPPAYKDPEVKLENLEAWSYALGGQLEIDDSYGAIQKGIKVGIYSRLDKNPGAADSTITDNKGNTINVYSADKYEGKSTVVRKTFVGSQPIALSPIRPGSTIYVQFYYRYNEEVEGSRVIDPETGAVVNITYERHTYYSDFYEMQVPTVEEGDVQSILANWDMAFAGHDDAMELDNFSITNSANYDPEMLPQDVDFNTFFGNFKKNTLPYIYRMEYTLTPRNENGVLDEGAAVTVMAGSSVMNKAKQEGGTVYTSTSPKLRSNTNYKVTVIARDRYGNEIPLQIGDKGASVSSENWESTVFTQKASPTVKIEEVENVTDKLSIKITVSDLDQALAMGADGKALPLKLTVANASGEKASIFGNWTEGGQKGPSFGDESTFDLELPEPADGKTYELDLLSLAFAQLYYVRVNGSYEPQPTAYGASSAGTPLERKEDEILGTLRTYTASLTDGSVNFTSRVVDLLDTYGTMEFTMSERSTVSALPLVDEFHFFLNEKESGEEVAHVTLKMSELDVSNSDKYQYDQATKSVLLQDGGATGPTVRLIGNEEQYNTTAGRNPWEALLIHSYIDVATGKEIYIPPMTLSIEMPKDTLKNSTCHVMKMEARVIKSGTYYQIPTSITLTEFITRKRQPKLEYEMFIAGDVLEYLNIRIDDPDETIRSENGQVYVDLYFKNSPDDTKGTRLQRKILYANQPETTLHFDGLIPGAPYFIKFETQSYNDGEGFTNQEFDYELWRHNITAGSFLTGDINLVGLDYHSRDGKAKQFYSISGAEVTAKLEETLEEFGSIPTNSTAPNYYDYWTYKSNNSYMTPMIELPDDATFLYIDDYFVNASSAEAMCIYFYTSDTDKNGRYLPANYVVDRKIDNYAPTMTLGRTLLPAIPKNAKYVRLYLPDRNYVETNGLRLSYYTTPYEGKNIFKNADDSYRKYGVYANNSTTNPLPTGSYDTLHQYPVKPGQLYISDMDTPSQCIQLYTKDKGYLGTLTSMFCTAFVVPDDVYYISVSYTRNKPNDRYLFLVSDADELEGYDAAVDVSVEDTQGYLYAVSKDDKPYVELNLYRSPSIEHPSFSSTPTMTQKVELVPKDPDVRADESKWSTYKGSWIPKDSEGTVRLLQEALAGGSRWRLVLSVNYMGSDVVLDTIEFQTDAAYDTISCNEDMRKVFRNPYGNYLVTADFEHYLNLGTNVDLNVYGSIDFQGHVITRRAGVTYSGFGNRPYLITNVYGSVRNLVYDYPVIEGETKYTNPGAVVYNVGTTGLLENVIVRTQGTVYVTSDAQSLLCYQNNGTIRNFVVKLGGDLRLRRNSHYLGGVFFYNYGTIEDGYVYAGADYGVIMYPLPSWNGDAYYGGLICNNSGTGVIRNIYTVHDTWYARPASANNYNYAMAGGYHNQYNGLFQDSYHVGEYYTYTGYMDELDKTRTTLYPAALQVTRAATQEMNQNISYFTDTPYQAHINNPRYIYQKPIKGLRDVAWQGETLGEAFDSEGCIPMGFYPRLKTLPTIMQKYQEYVPLPTASQGTVPVPVSDDWASEDYGEDAHKNETGYIRMVFKNDSEYQIETLTATVTANKVTRDTVKLTVVRQGRTSEGLWEVILRAEAVDYLSVYTINGMTYKVGNATVTAALSYKTQNLEFWKEIRDPEGWRQINANMTWNYKIMQDIDFSKTMNQSYMTIDGNVNGQSNTGFTGRIDGQFKKLSNMDLSNMGRPWVFYSLSNGSRLENLYFDTLTITAASGADTYTGLIRAAGAGTIRNVHVRNSTIRGIGNVGGILAYAWTETGPRLEGCSVAETTIEDGGGGYVLRMGGLVGYSYSRNTLQSCYTRNVTIRAERSSVVSAVGGLIGESYTIGVVSCYATGTIVTKASHVGGLVGYQREGSWSRIWDSWSNVRIDSSYTNGNVGGLSGYSNGVYNANCLVVGDILSASAKTTNRVTGNANDPVVITSRPIYAYSRQSVNNDPKTDVSQIRQLFDAKQLRDWTTWSEIIKLGRYWDYTPVTREAYPKVCLPDESGELVWGQTDIPLPDMNAYDMQVVNASYTPSADMRMRVELNIDHPGLDLSQYQNLSGAAMRDKMAEYFTLAIDGIDLTRINQGQVEIVWIPRNGSTGLIISNKDEARVKAMDLYPLSVTVGNTELRVQVDYGRPFYWEIPDIDTWNRYMDPKQENKGNTNENYRITGMIDFGAVGNTTEFVGLSLGRLEGPEGYGWKSGTSEAGGMVTSVTTGGAQGQGIGFKNLRYTAGTSGTPWIETVGHGLERLHFDDMGFYYPNTVITRERSAAITLCFGMKDLVFTDIHLETNHISNKNFGFVSRCEGSMERVQVDGLDMKRVGGNVSLVDNAGGAAAVVTGGFTELEGRNITVDMPYAQYTGGMVGNASNQNETNKGLVLTGTFENITVTGATYSGGVIGYSGRINVDHVTVTNATVTTSFRYAGAFAGGTGAYNYQRDILVSGCHINGQRDRYASLNYYNWEQHSNASTEGLGVGGYAGFLHTNVAISRLRVENTQVLSADFAGGVAGYLQAPLRDVEVYNCDITSKYDPTITGRYYNTLPVSMATGGVCAIHYGWDSRSIQGAVVRNTRITGRSNVGGVVGRGCYNTTAWVLNSFVADDVEIKATGYTVTSRLNNNNQTEYVYTENSNVGGLVGYTQSLRINNCICGASVSGPGNNVGGLVGQLNYTAYQTYDRYITNSIYAGDMVRGERGYVGGIIGGFLSADAKLKEGAISNVVVATNVVGGNGKNSLWINDAATVVESNQDSPSVFVWENATLNGQMAKDIVDAAGVAEIPSLAVKPASSRLLKAAELYTQEFYQNNGFGGKDKWGTKTVSSAPYDYVTTRSNWYIENIGQDGNTFFPYPAIAPWSGGDNKHSVGGAPDPIRPEGGVKGTDQTASQLLELARWADADLSKPGWTSDGKTPTGIKLPEKGAEVSPSATVVYASGIDTLNVETTTPNSPVTVCGKTLTTDDNGVASMTWDFKTPTGIDGYTTENLCRDTLVNGAHWYFIDKWSGTNNGRLRGGMYDYRMADITATETEFVKTADGDELTGVIHLWGRQALTSDGKIYDLEGLKAIDSGRTITSGDLTQKSSTQPFLTYRHGSKNTTVQVFHNFTLYGDVKIENQRLYQLDGKLYSLSSYKDYVYDGVLLMSAGSGASKESYFAVLDKKGDLTSYLSAIKREKWNSSGIKQMSNTFNPEDIDPRESNKAIVVLRYTNGRVCVVEFDSDKLLYESSPGRTGLIGYAQKYLTSIFRPNVGATVPQDPTYKDALDEVDKYRDPDEELEPGGDTGGSAGSEEPGDAELPGEGQGGGEGVNGEAPGGEDDQAGTEETDPDGQLIPGSGQGDGDQAGEPAGGVGGPDESDIAGEGGLFGEGEESNSPEPGSEPEGDGPADENGTEDGVNQINGVGGPEGPGGDEPGTAISLEGGVPGEEGDELTEDGSDELAGGEPGTLAPDGGAGGGAPDGGEDLPETLFMQPEEGKVFKTAASGGLEAVPVGSVSRDEKSGTYSVAGKTYYLDQSAQSPKDLPEAVTLISEELHTKQLMSELGPAMVAYDPITGQYSPYVTETLLGDAPRKTTDPAPGKTLGSLDEKPEAPEDTGNSDFEVGHGLGRDLTPREQSGFALLALAAIAAFAILGVLFAREKRRKR